MALSIPEPTKAAILANLEDAQRDVRDGVDQFALDRGHVLDAIDALCSAVRKLAETLG